jgi:hypothetical protein
MQINKRTARMEDAEYLPASDGLLARKSSLSVN